MRPLWSGKVRGCGPGEKLREIPTVARSKHLVLDQVWSLVRSRCVIIDGLLFTEKSCHVKNRI